MIAFPLTFLGGAVAGLVFLAYAEARLPKTASAINRALIWIEQKFA